MAKIFISTNSTQPANCFRTDADKLKIREYLANQGFPTDSVKEVSDNVYLILDALDVLPVTVEINQSEDFLLNHNTTTETVKNLFDANRRKNGHQTQREDNHYLPVFRTLINADIQDKFAQIITDIFPDADKERLERLKTDFLYLIYNGKTDTEIPKGVIQTDEIKQLHEHFTAYKYNKQWDDDGIETPAAEEQRRKLSLLRDALLANK